MGVAQVRAEASINELTALSTTNKQMPGPDCSFGDLAEVLPASTAVMESMPIGSSTSRVA
jgi:hypothetical protein